MNLFLEITKYFHGEKVEALVFILSPGLLSLVFGGWLITEGTSFARGVAIPFLGLGLVFVITGGVVGLRTPSQVRNLEAGLHEQKEITLKEEIKRMEKVNNAWPKYLVVWLAFGVIGLILRMATKQDFTQGIGIALVFFSGILLLIDGFAERRAVKYTHSLQSEMK